MRQNSFVRFGNACAVTLLVALPLVLLIAPERDRRLSRWRHSRPIEVAAVGREAEWVFRYPGADGRIDTHDDVVMPRRLLVPPRSRIVLRLTSEDTIYALAPNAETSQVAVPGQSRQLTFDSADTGSVTLETPPFCGFPPLHSRGMGELTVIPWRTAEVYYGASEGPGRRDDVL